MQDIDAREENLIEVLGKELFLEALLRQMSYDEKVSAFDYIERMYDVETDNFEKEY